MAAIFKGAPRALQNERLHPPLEKQRLRGTNQATERSEHGIIIAGRVFWRPEPATDIKSSFLQISCVTANGDGYSERLQSVHSIVGSTSSIRS